MQDVNWVVNVLPDMISEMEDDDVDCFSKLFRDEQETREAARLRDAGVLEPADVDETFPRERSRRTRSPAPDRPGREQQQPQHDEQQPGGWRRRDCRSRSRAVSRAREAGHAARGEPPRVDLQNDPSPTLSGASPPSL